MAAPCAERRCALTAGTGRLTAASERAAENDLVAARVLGAVVRLDEFASRMQFGLTLATDHELENDHQVFGFAQPEQGQHEERSQDQQPEVERAEFLLAIGCGLPRGP